jgi:hypothetical protein
MLPDILAKPEYFQQLLFTDQSLSNDAGPSPTVLL